MMRSLFSGVAGLRNHQTSMDVIGANISNVNTVGYKGSSATFSDVISQTLQGAAAASGNRGGTNPIQVGLGMGLAAISTNFTNGSYQSTGKQTDLAIQNDGFFILSDGANQYYSRAGNFDFDSAGNYLVPGTGMKVMGWQADATGAINTTGAVTSIQVPKGTMMPALASTKLTFANNLSGDALPGASAISSLTVYDTLGNPQDLGQTFTKVKTDAASETSTWLAKASIADSSLTLGGSTLTQLVFNSTGRKPEVTAVAPTATSDTIQLTALTLDATSGSTHNQYLTVFDSDKNPYVVKMTFTQKGAAEPNAWTVSLTDAASSTSTPLLSGQLDLIAGSYTYSASTPATFTINSKNFNLDKTSITGVTGTFALANTPTYGPATPSSVSPITFTAPGAAQSVIAFDVSALTQYGGSSTVQATSQNGYASGSLDSTTIDTSGILVGKFSNGRTQNLGQVALATFNNPGGLARIGDTLFASSNNSGNPAVGTSGTGGRGTLTPGSLEMSNIDLADQFSKMIITQRGFQANSKIITTSDTMLEELVNLKR